MRAEWGGNWPHVSLLLKHPPPYLPALPEPATHPLYDSPQDLVAQQLLPPLRLVLDVRPHIAGGLHQHQLCGRRGGGIRDG